LFLTTALFNLFQGEGWFMGRACMAVNIGREKAKCWGDYESTLADLRQKCLHKVLCDMMFYAGILLIL